MLRVYTVFEDFKIDEVLLLYDDTIWGGSDDGLAIILTTENKLLLLVAEYMGKVDIFCLNSNDFQFKRIMDVSISGFWGRSLKLKLDKEISEEKFNMGVKTEISNFEIFIKDLIDKTKLD